MSVEKTITMAYSDYTALQDRIKLLENDLSEVERISLVESPIFIVESPIFTSAFHRFMSFYRYEGQSDVIKQLVAENTKYRETERLLKDEVAQLSRRPQYILPTTFKERLKYLFTGKIKQEQ